MDADTTRAAIAELREIKAAAREAKRARALKMLSDGVVVQHIAQALGVGSNTVSRWAAEAGITPAKGWRL